MQQPGYEHRLRIFYVIGSPIIRNPLHLVAMNRPSLEKFAPMVRPGGVILINKSLIDIVSGRDDVDELAVPAVEIAKDLGNPRAANIVAVSAFAARTRIVDLDQLRDCVKEEFARKKKLIPLNLAAVDAGEKAALTPVEV